MSALRDGCVESRKAIFGRELFLDETLSSISFRSEGLIQSFYFKTVPRKSPVITVNPSSCAV